MVEYSFAYLTDHWCRKEHTQKKTLVKSRNVITYDLSIALIIPKIPKSNKQIGDYNIGYTECISFKDMSQGVDHHETY